MFKNHLLLLLLFYFCYYQSGRECFIPGLGRALQPGGQAGRSAGQECSEQAVMFLQTCDQFPLQAAPHGSLARILICTDVSQQAQLFPTAHCKGALCRAPCVPHPHSTAQELLFPCRCLLRDLTSVCSSFHQACLAAVPRHSHTGGSSQATKVLFSPPAQAQLSPAEVC